MITSKSIQYGKGRIRLGNALATCTISEGEDRLDVTLHGIAINGNDIMKLINKTLSFRRDVNKAIRHAAEIAGASPYAVRLDLEGLSLAYESANATMYETVIDSLDRRVMLLPRDQRQLEYQSGIDDCTISFDCLLKVGDEDVMFDFKGVDDFISDASRQAIMLDVSNAKPNAGVLNKHEPGLNQG